MINITVNGQYHSLGVEPEMPLLWVLRDVLDLKGTKYGCGVGLCGVCTVLIDGEANHACMVPLHKLDGRMVMTIEGVAGEPQPLLAAWIAEQVPQCGYCQPGQIMAAAALFNREPKPSDAEIATAMSGVLCRCGTYQRVHRAIQRIVRGEQMDSFRMPNVQFEEPDPESLALDEWIRIAPDGTVTLTINHSEMGQGVITGLSMLMVEELEADLSQVRVMFAPADKRYRNPMFDEQTTGGSTSIRGEWERIRYVGAQARMRLIHAAADAWKVRIDECRAVHGAVIHTPTNRRLHYGELITKAVTYRSPRKVVLKQRDEFRLLGRSQPRFEIPSMVTGRAVYGSDLSLTDTLVASIAHCPVFGGSVKTFDATATKQVAGVCKVIEMEHGVAVLAENTWAAFTGSEQLNIDWNPGTNADMDDKRLHQRLVEAVEHEGKLVNKRGDAERALGRDTQIIEAVYQTQYLAHAALEPMNCTARVANERCDVWVGTQSQESAQTTAMRVSGLSKDKVHIHTTLLGGGFGRRLESDTVAEAVELAKKCTGTPIQVLWSRVDDLQHDFYRPAHYTVLKAALDDKGMPIGWWQRAVGPSLALDMIDVPYTISNLRIEHVTVESAVPTGAWRSVGAGQNAFVVESFIDEMAHAAKQDPFTYRHNLLAHAPRHRAVLELAAEKAGWHIPTATAEGLGIALYYSFGSYVAQVAEVAIGDDQTIKVQRVVCAIDCGQVINPDAVRAQIEGGIAMGLSAALKEEVHFARGQMMQSTFEKYPILGFDEMPRVEVHLVNSGEEPGGVGEPGVPPIAPAVANAVFSVTGKRIRNLPLTL